MKRYIRMNIKPNIINAFIILLLAYCITFGTFLYVGHGIHDYYETTEPIIKTSNESVIKKGEVQYSFFTNASEYKAFNTNPTDNNLKINTNPTDNNSIINVILSIAVDLSSSCFLLIFFTVFFLFCLDLFTLLPDDITLINQKVRLDD